MSDFHDKKNIKYIDWGKPAFAFYDELCFRHILGHPEVKKNNQTNIGRKLCHKLALPFISPS